VAKLSALSGECGKYSISSNTAFQLTRLRGQKINIVMLSDWETQGGAAVAASRLAQALVESGERVTRGLNISERRAQMLMKVAANKVLANPNHGSHLPPSWRTLYELTKLPLEVLEEKIANGAITPDFERKEVAALKGNATPPDERESEARPASREAAKEVTEFDARIAELEAELEAARGLARDRSNCLMHPSTAAPRRSCWPMGSRGRTGKAKTVIWRWQERFGAAGVAALWRDKTRPPRIPPLEPEIAARVVSLTLAGPPADATHWTGAAMAETVGISVSSVQRIWRAHGLQPHWVRQFKLSNDPQFVTKLRDIVGLYVNPPDHAIVLSVDEKSQIQALDHTQPGLPMKRGRARHDDPRLQTPRHHNPVRRPRRS
jgi:hypothetical protein